MEGHGVLSTGLVLIALLAVVALGKPLSPSPPKAVVNQHNAILALLEKTTTYPDMNECKQKGCLWTQKDISGIDIYQKDVDWGYYSETDGDCAVCKNNCTNDPNCGAIECGKGYCSWWKVGQCSTEEEQVHDYFTCFKNAKYLEPDREQKYVFEDGPYGGNGGSRFSDGGGVHLNGLPSRIEIRSGRRVDGIGFSYGGTAANWHGGNGGTVYFCEIDDGDKIVKVEGRRGSFDPLHPTHRSIDQLQFTTSRGKICGPYGGRNGKYFTSSHPGCHLSYISGNAGRYLDQLTLHWECKLGDFDIFQ